MKKTWYEKWKLLKKWVYFNSTLNTHNTMELIEQGNYKEIESNIKWHEDFDKESDDVD